MNTRQKVLEEALKCVNGEREKQYGNPEDNFRRIADLWSVYLTSLFEDEKVVVDIDPIDVAKMMILFKIARSNGDKDKLDNYVDMIGYGACAAEIFENSEQHTSSCDDIVCVGVQGQKYAFKRYQKEEVKDDIQLADECKECDYAEKCMGTGVCLKEEEKKLLDNKHPYSYAHDKLRNYVEIKAKEGHVPLDKLKEINRRFSRELSNYLHDAVNDCVENGKQFLDCYKEIDELFAKYVNKNKPDKNKYGSEWKAYQDILACILDKSSKANVHPFDVVEQLIINAHASTEMALLLVEGKISFDDVTSYVEDAINELNEALK